jgi:hypothetical protein
MLAGRRLPADIIPFPPASSVLWRSRVATRPPGPKRDGSNQPFRADSDHASSRAATHPPVRERDGKSQPIRVGSAPPSRTGTMCRHHRPRLPPAVMDGGRGLVP